MIWWFKAKVANCLKHSLFVRRPGGDDAFADRERFDLLILQGPDERQRWFLGDHALVSRPRIEDDRSVLGNHAIKQVETVKVSKFAPGDQDYSSSCFLQALERIID